MVVQEAKCKGYDKLYSCWQRRENIIFIHLLKKGKWEQETWMVSTALKIKIQKCL